VTPEQRKAVFDELDSKGRGLLLSKGADYAGTEDVLANFKRNAERLGLTKYQVWAVYFGKHIDAIFNSIKAGPFYPQVNSEDLEGRVLDARNYLGLYECMRREDMEEVFGLKDKGGAPPPQEGGAA